MTTMKKLAATLCALAFLATGAQAQTIKDFLTALESMVGSTLEVAFELDGTTVYRVVR